MYYFTATYKYLIMSIYLVYYRTYEICGCPSFIHSYGLNGFGPERQQRYFGER